MIPPSLSVTACSTSYARFGHASQSPIRYGRSLPDFTNPRAKHRPRGSSRRTLLLAYVAKLGLSNRIGSSVPMRPLHTVGAASTVTVTVAVWVTVTVTVAVGIVHGFRSCPHPVPLVVALPSGPGPGLSPCHRSHGRPGLSPSSSSSSPVFGVQLPGWDESTMILHTC